MKYSHPTRIRLISVCILFFAALLIGRLYFLQIVHHDFYSEKADRQYSSVGNKTFGRGSIFFQNKDGTLVSGATLKSGYIVAVNTQILKNPEQVFESIKDLLPIEREDFLAKATKPNDPYEEVASRVDLEVGDKINALKIPGLSAYKEKWRFYPGGNIASHIIGILGFKGDEYAGRYGLERQYEKQLKREDSAYVNFFAEIFSNIRKVASGSSENEADIVTTIEPVVQTFLQNTIASTTERWSSDMTGAIIMDPKTGEIYAMETYPTFDLNHSDKEKNISIFSNSLVENVREMGSIIKPLTLAAGIDALVITPSSSYYDPGFVMVSGKRVSNFDGKERGIVSMQEFLSQSLNVGAVHIQKLLGNKRFSNYMFAFGLGEKTGIELPNEGANIVKSLKSVADIDYASASFGQSIALTPVSTVRALATIANGGYLVNPHIVKSVKYKTGIVINTPIIKNRQVLKPETTEEVSRMMVYSLDNVLSNGSLKMPDYSIAVKTGTAQIAKPGGGGYYEDQILHSFVGFFPAYNPRFIIFLYSVNPKGARFGSETLSVPFMDIVKFLINYYEIPPDR